MELGTLTTRDDTTSGLRYDDRNGSEVCFAEAKYLSDLSVKTEHRPLRNQMDRVIESLLCLEFDGKFPDNVVFTLLTPRIFKENFGSRFYSYKYSEYHDLLKNDISALAERIELKSEKSDKRFQYAKTINFIENRIEQLSFNWITFEDIFEKIISFSYKIDITNKESAEEVWEKICPFLTPKNIKD